MDWEELKMTIRKTTARKGRRSKSRDILKGESQPACSAVSNGLPASTSTHALNKDISIDITLDIHNNSSTSPTTTPTKLKNDHDAKRPPMRRISGGWADSGLKSLRSKKNSFDDERFQLTRLGTATVPTDNIPVIPDMDDVRDEIFRNEIAEPPSVSMNRILVHKELESSLLSQKAFSAIEGVDLTILTRGLQPQESLDEPDELWEWDKLFTEITAQINSEKIAKMFQKMEIGPDEIPPTAKHN